MVGGIAARVASQWFRLCTAPPCAWPPLTLTPNPASLQKASRARSRPLASQQRRRARRSDSGGEGGDDEGMEEEAGEALAALMAAQVGGAGPGARAAVLRWNGRLPCKPSLPAD